MVCLRHAEAGNTGTPGALPLVRLTPAGRRQAAGVARLLHDEGVTRVYASTAARSRETADIIAGTLGVPVAVVAGLGEMGLGRLEGSGDAATRARTLAVLRSWLVDGELGEAVADGEDGHTVAARVATALTSIASAHPGETVAVVGHVASLTTGLDALCGLGRRVWGAPLPHAAPFPVEWDGRTWRCPSWPA
ncbi:histidine phosphatase family protein [Nonomuraea aridisoli]|uniref:Histidine phosphatase family protein n=1 Tax=Nonomuraea aridisoli TaxID=2070368 RepID=A0A2W2DVB0_9ACTN|nr:histidine phosphatase family protein [Nonomuraea aridisoli]